MGWGAGMLSQSLKSPGKWKNGKPKHFHSTPVSKCMLSCSVVSDSLRPHGLWPARLLCPCDSPGKNAGVGGHSLLQFSSHTGLLFIPQTHQLHPSPSLRAWLLPDTAAAAMSFQSCPTLCNPIDSSPSGSPVPGILQARTLEWVAITFSNA